LSKKRSDCGTLFCDNTYAASLFRNINMTSGVKGLLKVGTFDGGSFQSQEAYPL
jgi:hypothetical protein